MRGKSGRLGLSRRLGRLLGVRSVAGQVLFLQVVVAVLLIVAAVVALAFHVRDDSERVAQQRSLAAAESFAEAPGTLDAFRAPNPTATFQSHVVAATLGSGVDFMTVMEPDGLRIADSSPQLVGTRAEGVERAAEGLAITEIYKGDPDDAARAVVPVFDEEGRVIGLVSAGVAIESVGAAVDRQLPVFLGAGAAALVLATGSSVLVSRRLRRQTRGLGPAEMTRMYEHHDAVLHAVREGVLIVSGGGRLTLANDEARRLLDLSADADRQPVAQLGLSPAMTALLTSGRAVTDELHLAGDRLLAVSTRPTDPYGAPGGTVATLRDTTELRALSGLAEVARERLTLLYEAGVRIGTTLDVVRTAEELSEVVIPRFADFATVELPDPVLRGEEPTNQYVSVMRRAAVSGVRGGHPLQEAGELISFEVPTTPMAEALAGGRAVLVADLRAADGWRAQDPRGADEALRYGIHSLVTVPLLARGFVVGMANFWRGTGSEPFEEEDLAFAEELAARAAVAIDNARRYSREHTMAVTLQRSLLPRVLPEQDAVEIAYRYLPAQAGVGGDWFDVIPLPGARVALVVGDVVGHGLHAAATMGRLRTAVHNFSALDLPPDELLGHLDELVSRIDEEEGGEGAAGITGATCLYAIYDPVSGLCCMATAGHYAPAVVRADGGVAFPEVPVFPPLGLGGGPFENHELRLAEGSRLVLYTDGLIEHRDRDVDSGLRLLGSTLADGGTRTPEETCQALVDAMLPPHRSDDIALLVARTRLLEQDRVADWDVPRDPAAVAPIRAACGRQLERWGLEEIGFTTELMLSELITNAIRYGSDPIHVRLLRDRALICEVSDGSSTSPHLRRAATTDEGGRGLFLVSQFAGRWGTRYTSNGKVMWTEQPLGAGVRPPVVPLVDESGW
ncbi:SpoIIE family protein phosphatase [Streptomyces sp. MUM 203J]|uniref:SpoIIE family protein phosphatase n=1 Tax=Streptomyces sp. MUM 203J TaxID=2791990 RepID=UPI001F035B52|nr:SpoIIE family protein phosphatase [Streptomyces sp. MUM 203J]MCH0540809.1 SpoIIE family protein phosphatase [Streptomyces sp. MUM 203J]